MPAGQKKSQADSNALCLKSGLVTLCIVMVVAVSAPVLDGQSVADSYVPLSVGGKAAVFGKRPIDPVALGTSAFTAGINQWQDSPEEWGQGMAGYGRRYGHKVATRGIENAIGFLVAVPLHEDPRYFSSDQTGIWQRSRHALKYTVVTRTDSGGETFAVWRFAGNYGAQFIANAWRPERYTDVSDTLVRGSVSIGYAAAANLFHEFWPDIKKIVFRR